AFLTLEGSFGYPIKSHGHRLLGGSLRPSIYRSWEALGRPYGQIMGVDDVEQYSRKYWLWWEAVQPVGRLSAGTLLAIEDFEPRVSSMDSWDGLDRCCGEDGLIQALLMLFWWGSAVNTGDRHSAPSEQWLEWDTAVQDFGDILTLIMQTPGFEKVARKR
ncbi:hypothetical protein HDZ31DRAFT_5047, partial [Schizophyllum fasciatum]